VAGPVAASRTVDRLTETGHALRLRANREKGTCTNEKREMSHVWKLSCRRVKDEDVLPARISDAGQETTPEDTPSTERRQWGFRRGDRGAGEGLAR